MGRRTVAILFGGRSSEHGISCVTAGGVLGAIDRDRWNVLSIGITPDGQWTLVADDPEALAITEGGLPQVAESADTVLPPLRTGHGWRLLREDGTHDELGHVDVVLPLLHGPFGEDGTLQGLLEMVDVRYVGAGVLASAAGMDKAFTKLVLAHAGLPVAHGVVLEPGTDWSARRAEIEALGLPVFVKPARAGSSIGVSRVASWEGLDAALATAAKSDPKVLVEAAVPGREIECGVLVRDGEVLTSPLGEIEAGGEHDFYDFDAKYLDEASVTLTCPVDLPESLTATVHDFARRAFVALGCESLARVDCFVGEDGVVVNEVNTMPGFTPFSMYPRMWATAGIEYSELLDVLLEGALDRPVGLR